MGHLTVALCNKAALVGMPSPNVMVVFQQSGVVGSLLFMFNIDTIKICTYFVR